MNILVSIGIAIGAVCILVNRFLKETPGWLDILLRIFYVIAIILIIVGFIRTRWT